VPSDQHLALVAAVRHSRSIDVCENPVGVRVSDAIARDARRRARGTTVTRS
jgi:hypothetical protein